MAEMTDEAFARMLQQQLLDEERMMMEQQQAAERQAQQRAHQPPVFQTGHYQQVPQQQQQHPNQNQQRRIDHHEQQQQRLYNDHYHHTTQSGAYIPDPHQPTQVGFDQESYARRLQMEGIQKWQADQASRPIAPAPTEEAIDSDLALARRMQELEAMGLGGMNSQAFPSTSRDGDNYQQLLPPGRAKTREQQEEEDAKLAFLMAQSGQSLRHIDEFHREDTHPTQIPATQSYPPQTQSYPPQSQSYPPQTQSYPPQTQLYPSHGHGQPVQYHDPSTPASIQPAPPQSMGASSYQYDAPQYTNKYDGHSLGAPPLTQLSSTISGPEFVPVESTPPPHYSQPTPQAVPHRQPPPQYPDQMQQHRELNAYSDGGSQASWRPPTAVPAAASDQRKPPPQYLDQGQLHIERSAYVDGGAQGHRMLPSQYPDQVQQHQDRSVYSDASSQGARRPPPLPHTSAPTATSLGSAPNGAMTAQSFEAPAPPNFTSSPKFEHRRVGSRDDVSISSQPTQRSPNNRDNARPAAPRVPMNQPNFRPGANVPAPPPFDPVPLDQGPLQGVPPVASRGTPRGGRFASPKRTADASSVASDSHTIPLDPPLGNLLPGGDVFLDVPEKKKKEKEKKDKEKKKKRGIFGFGRAKSGSDDETPLPDSKLPPQPPQQRRGSSNLKMPAQANTPRSEEGSRGFGFRPGRRQSNNRIPTDGVSDPSRGLAMGQRAVAATAGGVGVASAAGMGVASAAGMGAASAAGMGVASAAGMGVASAPGMGAASAPGMGAASMNAASAAAAAPPPPGRNSDNPVVPFPLPEPVQRPADTVGAPKGPLPYSYTVNRDAPEAPEATVARRQQITLGRNSGICSVCKQSAQNPLSALDKKFHSNCFRCISCHEVIDPSGPFAYIETADGKQPMHRRCYAELFGIKCCVCKESIPAGPDGKVSFVKHPFFDTEQMCPRHARNMTTRRCTGCHRFEPENDPFADLNDVGRCVCMACCRSVIVDSEDAQPLWAEVVEFFDKKLKLPIWKDFREIPILVVGYNALNDQMKNTANVHGGATQIMTRGLCLTEHESGRRFRANRMRFNKNSMRFDAADAEARGFTFFQVPDASKVNPDASVTAILCLSGLPRDLAASVLAHEATHAWIKLHPRFDIERPIPPQVEEGCAQLIALLFLNEGLPPAPPLDNNDGTGPSDEKLRQYFKFSIETDDHEIYGTGFRRAALAYSMIGIEALMSHIVLYQDFPET